MYHICRYFIRCTLTLCQRTWIHSLLFFFFPFLDIFLLFSRPGPTCKKNSFTFDSTISGSRHYASSLSPSVGVCVCVCQLKPWQSSSCPEIPKISLSVYFYLFSLSELNPSAKGFAPQLDESVLWVWRLSFFLFVLFTISASKLPCKNQEASRRPSVGISLSESDALWVWTVARRRHLWPFWWCLLLWNGAEPSASTQSRNYFSTLKLFFLTKQINSEQRTPADLRSTINLLFPLFLLLLHFPSSPSCAPPHINWLTFFVVYDLDSFFRIFHSWLGYSFNLDQKIKIIIKTNQTIIIFGSSHQLHLQSSGSVCTALLCQKPFGFLFLLF